MSKTIATFTLRSSSIPSSFEITEDYDKASKLDLCSLKPDLSVEKELVETADAILEAKAWREQAAIDANNAKNNSNLQSQQNTASGTTTVQFAINDETKTTEGNTNNNSNSQTVEASKEGNKNNTASAHESNTNVMNDGAENEDVTNIAATTTAEGQGVESTVRAPTAAPVSTTVGNTSDVSPLPSNVPSAEATPRLPVPSHPPINTSNVDTNAAVTAHASSTSQPVVQQSVIEEKPGIEAVPGINSKRNSTDAQSIEAAMKESKITSIMERTQETRDTCIFYLEMMDWDVENSLEIWQQMTS